MLLSCDVTMCFNKLVCIFLQMNAILDKLSRTSSELVSMYKSPGESLDHQVAPFLSQQSLHEYHGSEEKFTQQLTAFTKKQFFEVCVVWSI